MAVDRPKAMSVVPSWVAHSKADSMASAVEAAPVARPASFKMRGGLSAM